MGRLAEVVANRLEAVARRLRGGVEAPPLRSRHSGRGRQPKFYHDHEVRAFVEGLYGTCTLDSAIERCRAKFGASRSPSRTALHRYWQRLDREIEHA